MPTGRVISRRIPICPGRNSRFTIRQNPDQGNLWWVYYEYPTDTLHPADDAHSDLVELVNDLKLAEGNQEGGGFSINEHFQVIARTKAPGYGGQAIHVVGLHEGDVVTYEQTIVFEKGMLSPTATPLEGEKWVGPLCGTTYSFTAVGNPQAPSLNFDEVFVKIAGQVVQVSVDAGINPYPPQIGPLASFLAALRRQLLEEGGRFRVNEHGRAFTSDGHIFIGIVPLTQWFKPLAPLS